MDITNDLLIKLAGEPAFIRGQSVYDGQQIESWARRKNTINAVVQGTSLYRVKLVLTHKMLDGVCSCPASENYNFCKHCVAVALAVSAHELAGDSKSQGTSKNWIEAYLMQQSKKDLLKHLLVLINQDPQLEKQWLLKAELSHDGVNSKLLKKKITQAIPYRSLWDYRQVEAYFSNVEAAIALLIEPVSKQSPDEQLKLVMYAYQRLNKALERVDDSGGFRFGLEEYLFDALSDAYHALDWTKKDKATFLCDQLEQSYDVFPSIPEDFMDENDEELMALFIACCESRWSRLFTETSQPDHEEFRYSQISRVLLDHAKNNGDIEREIEILSATAYSGFDYQKLAEKHIKLEKYDEALWWLAKAKKADHHKFSVGDQYLPLYIQIDIERKPNFIITLNKAFPPESSNAGLI